MKAITDKREIKKLYKKILDYEYDAGRYLMQFQALTGLRNVGLYRLKWDWIDWERKIITYSPDTYKDNKNSFTLPLMDILIQILQYFKKINGSSLYVFRSSKIYKFFNKFKAYYERMEKNFYISYIHKIDEKIIKTAKNMLIFEENPTVRELYRKTNTFAAYTKEVLKKHGFGIDRNKFYYLWRR